MIFMLIVWWLPIVTFVKNNLALLIIDPKISKIELLIFSVIIFIPFINLFIMIIMDNEESKISSCTKKFNKVVLCRDCGIYSKLGRVLIHKQFDGESKRCPYCESSYIRDTYNDEGSPISKSFGYKETFQLQKQIYNYKRFKEENDQLLFKDSQLEKYQKIQEEKLNRMMKERGL